PSPLNMSEEKIILNVGGIKYETLRSTLTSQPDTLLGTMFRDQNEYIKNSVNGNEYFFDQSPISYQQLKEELDYFQINGAKAFSSLASETAISAIDRFISVLEQLIISHYVNFDNKISLSAHRCNFSVDNNNNNDLFQILNQIRGFAFIVLYNMQKRIEKHLVETFSELDLKWKCRYNGSNHSFMIEITFSSPIEKLLKLENAQAHITFAKTPINASNEKIILNVGGKKYETFQSTLVTQPETLLGTMFQDRNKCMRHPVNGNEYFFDRNSEAFYYIMEFYRTGKLTLPNESEKVTFKQLEEELNYFQIPFNKSTLLCKSALETVRNNVNNLILRFEELIIRCCDCLRNNIKLEINHYGINIVNDNGYYFDDLKDLKLFYPSNFKKFNTYSTLDNIEKQI
ncbi:22064_t:CDS:2, partial [Dentiscutata erythropus]